MMMFLRRIEFLMNRDCVSISVPEIICASLRADCRLPICGTLSALASFNKKLSQARKSAISNQQSAMIHLSGGVR